MPYTLNFSDPGNLNTVTVPDYPPGLNAVDTSLSFIGKSYPNYGQVIDQNFLKLLENFAGPLQPNAPIKGQLWYDSYSKSLKLFDGNVWKGANGIYQQASDPSISAPVSYGDIWVDTANTLLKIRGSGEWIQVGPSISEGTGIVSETFTDANNPASERTVLVVKVNNTVVAVLNDGDEFEPTTYPYGATGFTTFVKGITLPDVAPDNYFIKGNAYNSYRLNGEDGANYLRKNDSSSGGQVITGKVVFQTPASSGQENRDGVIIRTAGDNPALNYIQFFKKGNDAIVSNEVKSGKIIFKIKGLNDTNQTNAVTVEKGLTTVIGNLAVTSGVVSASTFTGTLSAGPQSNITAVGTLTNLSIAGNASITGSIDSGNITSTGTVRASFLYADAATIKGIYSTGTLQVWAGTTSTGIPNGWLVCDGSAKSQTAYPGLYQVLGSRYGIPVAGNFYIPNMVINSPLPPGDPRGATTATYYIIKQD